MQYISSGLLGMKIHKLASLFLLIEENLFKNKVKKPSLKVYFV